MSVDDLLQAVKDLRGYVKDLRERIMSSVTKEVTLDMMDQLLDVIEAGIIQERSDRIEQTPFF